MSHAIDMAQFLCGPIRRVVATKETFVRERPLPVPGQWHALRPRQARRPDRARSPTRTTSGRSSSSTAGPAARSRPTARSSGRRARWPSSSTARKGAASWDHEKLNQLRLYLPEEQPNDGFIEVLAGDAFPNQGNIVPGGGNSLGYEDLKLIEALEFLRVRGGRATAQRRASTTRWPTPPSPPRWPARGRSGAVGGRHQPPDRLRGRRCWRTATKAKLAAGEAGVRVFRPDRRAVAHRVRRHARLGLPGLRRASTGPSSRARSRTCAGPIEPRGVTPMVRVTTNDPPRSCATSTPAPTAPTSRGSTARPRPSGRCSR